MAIGNAGISRYRMPAAGRRRAGGPVALALGLLVAGCGPGSGDAESTVSGRSVTIGFLRAVQSGQPQNQAAFLALLAEAGYRSGTNLVLLAGDLAEVHPDPADAEATVRAWDAQGVDLVIALSTASARAARNAAPDVPVLFLSNDPVGGGLLQNLRQPEGQLTGVTFRVPPDRTLDFARQALPSATTIGMLYPSDDMAAAVLKDGARQAADLLGIDMVEATFVTADDVRGAIGVLQEQEADAVWALNSPTTARFFPEIGAATTDAGLPVITNTAADFAVVILHPDTEELYRQLARQALRLLDGTPVGNVPVEDPARFIFELNLRAATALGLDVPAGARALADQVVS